MSANYEKIKTTGKHGVGQMYQIAHLLFTMIIFINICIVEILNVSLFTKFYLIDFHH